MISMLGVLLLMAFVGAAPSVEHLQHIPVHGYNPKLQLLGQHVDLHEIPVKIIRITKTVAVKIPVPYPVKIPHKVPYPVHINKPYPVPVTQIVKVPHPVPVPVPSSGHQQWDSAHQGVDSGYQSSGASLYQSPVSSYGADSGYSGGQSGYGQGYGGSEQYGESQQISSPVVYQQSGGGSYHQGQEGASHDGGDLGYSGSQSAQSYQDLGRNAYQGQLDAAQYQQSGGHAADAGSAQSSQGYTQHGY